MPHECECKICQASMPNNLQYASNLDALAYLSKPEGSNHKRDTDTHVFFYEQEFYVLSNFSAFQVQWQSIEHSNHSTMWHQTAEHLYHYLKFRYSDGQDSEQIGKIIGVKHRIFNAKSAHDAFRIAQENKHMRRPDWDAIKVRTMKSIITAKACQHEYVYRKLMQTGTRILVEDSYRDDFWGWGENKNGRNVLGNLWMEVRDDFNQGKIKPNQTVFGKGFYD